MRTYTFWIIVIILVSTFVWLITLPRTTEAPLGCTMEALICPDGSAVGRTGPNCEFAPCPETLPNTPHMEDDVSGEVVETPVPPQGENFLPPPEYDRPYDGAIACTMDAKMCADGSYVGRVAPNCNFAPCPGEENIDTSAPQDESTTNNPTSPEPLILSQ